MEIRILLLAVGVAASSVPSTVAAAQREAHQGTATSAPTALDVAQCRQAQGVVTGIIDAAMKRLDDARLTNSAAAMRDATDDLQAVLVDLRTQLAPCAEMQIAAGAPAGPSMPTAHQAPAAAPAMPAPGGAAPHVGHVMPATPPAAAPRAASPAASRPPMMPRAVPAAADPHAGHAAPARPAAPANRTAASPTSPAPAATAATAGRNAARRPAPPTDIADLKCTTTVDPKTTPRMLYQGRMYYFCSEQDRGVFAKDPAEYVTAPLTAAPGTAPPAHAH
jgi:YHS domain-containing protein